MFACLCLLAALAGYAEYPVQAAWSGLLPVGFVDDVPWSRCIGLFSYYNTRGTVPAVNTTVVQLGFAVSETHGCCCSLELPTTPNKWP